MRVYLGGPVDYVANSGHEWRHGPEWAAFDAYCPVCGHSVPDDDWDRVGAVIRAGLDKACDWAEAVLLRLDEGTTTIGTPIEAWEVIQRGRGDRLLLVHPGRQGLFVQYMVQQGATVVQDYDAALAMLRRWGRT